MAQRIIKSIFIRPGPPGPPGNLPGLYYTAGQIDTILEEYALAADFLPKADVLDEDDFASNSATKPPSQQSTKAYVDTGLATKLNKTDVLDEDDFASNAPDKPPSQQSTGAYVDAGLATKVSLTGDETIAGTKTFTATPIIPGPTQSKHAAHKDYVDINSGAVVFSSSAPTKLRPGKLWYDTSAPQPTSLARVVTVSATEPDDPVKFDLWIDL